MEISSYVYLREFMNNTCGALGSVISRSISIVNDTYTSQLTITANHQLNGTTIECAIDRSHVFDRRYIFLTTGI